MIRRNERFLSEAYVLSDIITIGIASILSWWIKFSSGIIPSEYRPAEFNTYFPWIIAYIIISAGFGYLLSLYSPKRKKSFTFEIYKVIQVLSLSLLALLSLLFALKQVDISRQFLGILYVLNIGLVLLYRYFVNVFLHTIRKKGYNRQFVLILGAGTLGSRFYENLKNHPKLGFEVIGFLDDIFNFPTLNYKLDKPLLGCIDDLESVLKNNLVDEVIVALPLNAHEKYATIINTCEKYGQRVLIIPDYFDYLPAKPYFDNFAGIPLINVRDIPLDEYGNKILKRAFDIVFSSVAILLVSPLLILIAIGVKLTSPGPVIFKQERVGLNRRVFSMYKFRSMRTLPPGTVDLGWTTKDDPRKTRFGSFLRKTSLDELPQFFNVLFGHMSVVGPRPERPHFVEQFKEEIPKYMVKHHIRPGITGWAQSNGLRGDTSIEDRISYDIFYIENWTFLFDLKIIYKTIWNGFVNKNAY
ncbi:undecaprenyl-phosphate glucose phosphotransferase [Paenibacillus aurantius]|uniref:Undecaprenyl-phosphate glucose phosphotransferase n=1 Tax=Paenibacillus aurantius TaxID=2918900 RepID=A0AA96LAW6_9BACL|nr:undecaprenyl-phosphate glucose phosphotransferase [Paenibacillus aurantius]WNQ10419.1 undecaprenyl-phosphate glucose phosphotransferase [Paenibacillus aurantius]